MSQTSSTEQLKAQVIQLAEQGNYAEVRALLAKNTLLTRESVELAWRMGRACFRLELYQEAGVWLERARELKPENAQIGWALGQTYAEMDRPQDAEREMLRSIALRDSTMGRQVLGFFYHCAGRLHEAESVYREGIRLCPNDAERWGCLADFLSDIGDESAAQECYARSAELKETNK